MDPIIAPSILSADFGFLDRDVRMVEESAAGWLHLDIMDGTFVPNISYGFPVCKAIAKASRKPMDAHLMIVHPEKYVSRFAELGVRYLSVHVEACDDLPSVLSLIRSCGMKAGVAINPETDVCRIGEYVPMADYILVMSVHPGFGGQKFIGSSLDKVDRVRRMIEASASDCFIEVDGGIGPDNVAALVCRGARVIVAGSSVFASGEASLQKEAIAALDDAARAACL